MPVQRRECVMCHRRRDVKFFSPDARRKDGLSPRCQRCAKAALYQGSRSQRLMETYGITADEYDKLLLAQRGRCAICGGRRMYNLDVDHDHALERDGKAPRETVRGLLCKACNRRLLRAAKDSVPILQAAIRYLRNPPAWAVIGQQGGDI